MAESPVRVGLERDGALLRLTLDRPKANICDAQMIAALQAALDAHAAQPGLRGVLLDAAGPHFSFGASVEEHLAERCAGMLAALHALILALAGCRVPVLVAVRGLPPQGAHPRPSARHSSPRPTHPSYAPTTNG